MLKDERKINPLSKYSLTFSIFEFIIQAKNSIIEKERGYNAKRTV